MLRTLIIVISAVGFILYAEFKTAISPLSPIKASAIQEAPLQQEVVRSLQKLLTISAAKGQSGTEFGQQEKIRQIKKDLAAAASSCLRQKPAPNSLCQQLWVRVYQAPSLKK